MTKYDWLGVDWTQVPASDVVSWRVMKDGQAIWVARDGGYYLAPSFGYKGNWQDSLEERPHDNSN